ncbi:MAG TPA: DUF4407 domain-containing protein [Pyrinomonadaceae bacterium]|nr:DUF4407 domain-containing protein [Pyrinomonadaceae bacterium]
MNPAGSNKKKTPRPSLAWRTLTLRPYGENLLTSGAATWIFVARIIVLLMASAEAISWGYVGSLFSQGWGRYVSTAIAGGFVFTVIWGIDVTLMTLDRSGRLFEDAEVRRKTKWSQTAKEILGFGARWIIIISSLAITAPFLAQIIFGTDIRKELERQSATTITTARAVIDEKYTPRIEALTGSFTTAQNELTDEIAGRLRLGSGLYGNGPVAKSIENRIDDQKSELRRVRQEQEEELRAFDKAVSDKDYEQLSGRWGVVLPESSVIERGKILAQIVQIPTYTKTEWAVRAFLVFLFLSLFILKIFEPRSVRIYLSEALQQEWKRYLAGAFDIWLTKVDKSNAEPSAMTPFRFQDLMVNVYPAIRSEDINRRRSMKVEEDARNTIERLAALKDEMTPSLQETRRARTEIVQQIDEFVRANERFFSAFERETREVAELETILKDIDLRQTRSQSEPDDVKSIELRIAKIMAEANVRQKLGNLEKSKQRRVSIEQKLSDLYETKNRLDIAEKSLLERIQRVDSAIESVRTHRLEDATLSIFADMVQSKPDEGGGSTLN